MRICGRFAQFTKGTDRDFLQFTVKIGLYKDRHNI